MTTFKISKTDSYVRDAFTLKFMSLRKKNRKTKQNKTFNDNISQLIRMNIRDLY